MRKFLLTVVAVLALPAGLIAQKTPPGQSPDNVVTLLSAQSAELLEIRGQSVRKVVGPARFYHNSTYLICDTAYWNVDQEVIKAIGHVKIVQNRTKLTSETLDYIINENMAKFRGMVQLEDKDKNVLRTKYLDYNTKDSVAVFQNGGAMKSSDGQIIESRFGSYESKIKTFTFMDNVHMFSDSTLIKTSRLLYNSGTNIATFGYGTDVWNDTNMLSANDGWFDRGQDIFFFRRNVHVMTQDREGWSDSLFYKRPINEVEMLGRAQIIDTTRDVRVMAGRIFYQDTLSMTTLTRRPVIISINEDKDTVLVGGDTLVHRSIKRCDVDSMTVVLAEKRMKDLSGDPVMEHRRKAAEAAAKAAEEAAREDPNRPPDPLVRGKPGGKNMQDARPVVAAPSPAPRDTVPAPPDTLSTPPDTLAAPADTLVAPADTVPPPPKDTTKIDFVWAWSRVKLHRKDIQLACDSLAYTGLDSLVRIYKEPFVFQEGTRQYSSDSIYVVVRKNAVEKASLMSNAFILIQEDTVYYDQIKGAEMLAYFDTTGALRRFDGLGGSTALFFLEENNAIATVNKVEAKMLSATFRDGDLERILYFDSAKNDAFPVVQMPFEDQRMKGFNWKPELRPKGLGDMTTMTPCASERKSYLSHPKPDYPESEVYFPGYMKKILAELKAREGRPRGTRKASGEPVKEPDPEKTGKELPPDDTPSAPSDTARVTTPSSDGSALPADSNAVAAGDSTHVATPVVTDPKAQKKAEKERIKAEKERLKAEKQAQQEARWAELDRRDAEKAEAKKQKKLAKKRAATLKALKREAARAAKEKALYEKYLLHYKEKKSKP